MPVGQAVTATSDRRAAGAAGAGSDGADGVAVAAAAALAAAAAAGALAGAGVAAGADTTLFTRSTTSCSVVAPRSPSVNSFFTRARASWVSTLRWVASPPAGAAIRNARSAGPSLAPKSVPGESRANASVGTSTCSVRQCGIAMPPGRPVAEVASRARASSARPSGFVLRPASAATRASARITSVLSLPSETSRRTSSGVIIDAFWSVISTSVPCVEDELADLDELGTDVGGGGDRRTRKSGGGAAVGHGEAEPFVRLGAAEVAEQVAEQAGVAGPDGADDGGRG